MKYLETQEILVIHDQIIEETGGVHGVRDIGLLQSATVRPRTAIAGKEMFGSIFEKAASLLEAFARFHVFTDGNKRTAAIASARFLAINNHELTATNDELVIFMVSVVESRLEITEIAAWFKKHSKRIRKGSNK